MFPAVFTEGKRDASGPILLICRPSGHPMTRFGCIANAKTFPLSVDRHRAKRVAREAIRFYLSHIRPGYDMIVVYRFRPKTTEQPTLRDHLGTLLKRHSLLQI